MDLVSKKKAVPEVLPADEAGIRAACSVLRAGGLVVIPTETVYGLAGDLSRPGVQDKMYAAKGRPESKPIPLLAASVPQVRLRVTGWSRAAERLAERFWPGPLTLVLEAGGGFLGFRIPDYPVTLALLKEFGSILGATSANRSGEAPALTAVEAEAALGAAVDLILDDGPSPGREPSTVVKVVGDRVEMIRAGAIPAGEIQAALA